MHWLIISLAFYVGQKWLSTHKHSCKKQTKNPPKNKQQQQQQQQRTNKQKYIHTKQVEPW